MTKHYTGVGSRETPEDVLELIRKLAYRLAINDWILRSGAAEGADTAFEKGCVKAEGQKRIYVVRDGKKMRGYHVNRYSDEQWRAAMELAASVHPAWNRCSDFARALHTRNCFQVLGQNLSSPSKFLVCWTRDGAETGAACSIETGGTATAIRIASKYNVPIFNLFRAGSRERIERWLH